MIAKPPLLGSVAAVSIGLVNEECLLDLCYIEDSTADVDMNIVMRDDKFIEVQGTAEGLAFGRDRLNTMLDLAAKGIADLVKIQKQALES